MTDDEYAMPAINIGRFGDEPDFINQQGVKWWMIAGNIWRVQHRNGKQEYVGLRDGNIVANSGQYEAVALKLELIDIEEQTRPAPDTPQKQANQPLTGGGAPAWMKPKKPDDYDGPVCIDCGHPMPRTYDHHKTCDCSTCDIPE